MKYIRDTGLISAEMDGDIVMMSIENGCYYGLTGTARAIWDHLETDKSVDELMTLLQPIYEVSEEVLRADVGVFLTDLLQKGLVQVA